MTEVDGHLAVGQGVIGALHLGDLLLGQGGEEVWVPFRHFDQVVRDAVLFDFLRDAVGAELLKGRIVAHRRIPFHGPGDRTTPSGGGYGGYRPVAVRHGAGGGQTVFSWATFTKPIPQAGLGPVLLSKAATIRRGRDLYK